MLKAYFNRTRLSGFILLTLLAAITWIIYYFFISQALRQKTDTFSSLYSEDCPKVIFDHGTVRMQGAIPFTNQNENREMVLFDTTRQITKIPEDAAVGSILFTDQNIVFRSSVKDHAVSIRDIEIDRLELSHSTIKSFLEKYLKKFLSILAIGGFVFFWTGTLLLVLIGGGLMLGIDYLVGGKKSGRVVFNFAAAVLAPAYLFWWFHRIYDLGMSHLFTTIFLLYIIAIIILTAATRNCLNDPEF